MSQIKNIERLSEERLTNIVYYGNYLKTIMFINRDYIIISYYRDFYDKQSKSIQDYRDLDKVIVEGIKDTFYGLMDGIDTLDGGSSKLTNNEQLTLLNKLYNNDKQYIEKYLNNRKTSKGRKRNIDRKKSKHRKDRLRSNDRKRVIGTPI